MSAESVEPMTDPSSGRDVAKVLDFIEAHENKHGTPVELFLLTRAT